MKGKICHFCKFCTRFFSLEDDWKLWLKNCETSIFYLIFLWTETADRGNVITLWIKREKELNFSDCSLFSAAYKGIGTGFSAIYCLRKNFNGFFSWNSNGKKKAIQNNKKQIQQASESMFFCLQTINLHFTKYRLFYLIKSHCTKLSCFSFPFATPVFSSFFHEIRN